MHVVAGHHHDAEFGLADRQDARILQPSQRAGVRHVRVEHRGAIRHQPVHRGMDAVADCSIRPSPASSVPS